MDSFIPSRTCCCEMQLKMQLNQSLINNDFQLIHNINKSFVLLLCIATSVKSMWVYLALGSLLHNAAFWPSFVQFCLFCIHRTRFNITHSWIITPPKYWHTSKLKFFAWFTDLTKSKMAKKILLIPICFILRKTNLKWQTGQKIEKCNIVHKYWQGFIWTSDKRD